LDDLDEDVRIKLDCILNKWDGSGLESHGCGKEGGAGFCEQGNKFWGSVK
jgi:hypothetical protein